MNRGTQLVKNSIIIVIGKIATQFVSFIMLPLYTTMLTTAEYGMVDLLTTYVQLLLPIMTLLIEQAAFRYLLDYQDVEGKGKIVSNSMFLITIMSIVYSVIFIALSPFLKNDYKFYVLAILICSSYSGWGLQIARGFKNMQVYAFGSFFTTTVAIILNVLFISWFHMGITGMLLATIISNIVCSIYIFKKLSLLKFIRFRFTNKEILIDMAKYSVPLIPNQLSLWIINFSDRSIVNFFMDISANGILAISHKFSSIYSTIFGMFQLSWQEVGSVHFEDEDRDDFFTEIFSQIYAFFSSMCIGLISVVPFIFPILIQESYHDAYYTIPIYLVAVLCNITVGLLGVVYVALKKTSEIAKSTIYAGILNIIIHFMLIRKFGLFAAAISTLISYFIVMIYRMFDTKKYLNIKYNYKLYISSAITVLFVTFMYYQNDLVSYICSFLVAIIYTMIVNKKFIKSGFLYVKNKMKK